MSTAAYLNKRFRKIVRVVLNRRGVSEVYGDQAAIRYLHPRRLKEENDVE